MPPGNCTQGNVLMTEVAVTNCNTLLEVKYSYKIDLQSNGSVDLQAAGDTVSGNFVKGIHRITWRATDNCGHATTCAYSFTVKDCNPPNMVCFNGSTQTLDPPSCTVAFTASQFILSAVDDCTPANQLQFGIRELGTGTGFPTETSVTFETCDQGLHTLEIWSRDANGLTNQCNSYVLVEDGVGGCACINDANVHLPACVRTAANTRLSDYQLRLKVESIGSAGQPFTKQVVKSGTDSCSTLTALKIPLNGTYRATVRAERFGNPLNGVTTFDLVQISRHILGLAPLANAYQGIAADVNNSRTITASDIVETRKLILGIYDSFPGVPSWRLIRPLVNPTDFSVLNAVKDTYQIIIPALAADVTLSALPFVAVKTGDVNLSALSLGGEVESRGAPLRLQIDDLYLEAGEEVTVPIRLATATTLAGWQLALRADPTVLQITGVAGLSDEDYVRSADGALRALWFDGRGQDFAAGDLIFTLKIKALRPARLAQVLALDSSGMASEAYADLALRRPLVLNFPSKATGKAAFLPPQPNPFGEETLFQYRLGQPGDATLDIFDAAGTLVHQQTMSSIIGINTVSVSASTLPSAGVYAFRLRVGGEVFAGRLVRM